MAVIECKNVVLSYENTVVARNLKFTVNEGDFLCIVGENGSGKSTLVKAILGLKSVTGGELNFGEGVTTRQIGYLPQQTTAQKDFPASVFEVVLSGCLSDKKGLFYSKENKQTAIENMKKLEIETLKNRCYRELSGGQQQRVLLARALCAAKKLLLLDEPVAGLDPVVTADFYSLIEKINREYGMTVVMVSHDLLYAATHASYILHMRRDGAVFAKAADYVKSDIFKAFKAGAQDD
ncbi:MAG: metal ABC transporter ATP-binding protein [Acutalibacteraceae bacterium]